MVGLDGRVMAPLLPSIALDLGTSVATASYAVSLYLLPYGLCQLAYGPLAERFGKLRVVSYAMIAFSVGTATCGALPSLTGLLTMRALTGAAAAGLIPLTLAYIGDTVPYGRRQATLAVLMASAGAAQGLGTAFGGLLASVLGWRGIFPVLGLLSAVVTLRLLRAARYAEVTVEARRPASYGEVLRSPLGGILGLVLVEGALFMGCLPFVSGLMEDRFSSSPLVIGFVLASAGAAQLFVARALPWFLARWDEPRLVLLGGAAMAAAYFVCAAAPSAAWVVLGCSALGAGFSLCHSTLQARATEAFPSGRGRSLALFAFTLFVGGAFGSLGMAALTSGIGYGASFTLAGAAYALFAHVASRKVRRGDDPSSLAGIAPSAK